MIKVIDTDNYVFDDLVASLVSDGPGIDMDNLVKRAAAEHIKEFKSMKPKKGHSLVHVIAMGASDFTGANRNADVFFEKACSLDLPEKYWKRLVSRNGRSRTKSASTFADETKTGLIDTYKTFEDGHVFKHHKNKPKRGDEIFGEVKMAAYNEPMHRVELLLELPNEKWEDELQKMASGQDTSWSMACSCDPFAPVLTEYGYRPIAGIEEGTAVLTHKRSWKAVTKTMKRKYTGWAYKIKTSVSPYTLFLTEDHPLLASFSREHAKAYSGKKGINSDSYKHPHWNEVSRLDVSDFLQYLSPDFFSEYSAIENSDFAYALGRIFGGCKLSDFEADMLSPFLSDEYAQKTLYLGLFNSSEDIKLVFIGGLIDSINGLVAYEEHTNDVDIFYIDSNKKAICEIRDLLASIGIESEVINGKAVVEGQDKEIDVYKLDIPNSYFSVLEPYSGKLGVLHLEIDTPKEFQGEQIDIYRPVNIVSIEKEWVEDIDVYNIEVEDDNSYVIDGIVSHNCNVEYDICSICGNKAKNRGDYCDHASSHLGDMTKEGHVVAVVNENPNFFDISKVGRNADRIAFSIEKVAGMQKLSGAERAEDYDFSDHVSLKSAMAHSTDVFALNKIELFKKLAEIEKTIEAEAVGVKSNPEIKAVQKKTKNKILKACKGNMNKVSSCLSKLSEKGIMLPLEKFADLFFEDCDAKDQLIRQAKKALKSAYSNNMGKMAEVANNKAFKIDKYVIDNSFDNLAESLYKDLSFNSDAVRARVIDRSFDSEFEFEKESDFTGEPSESAKELCRQFMSYQLEYLNDQINTHGKNTEKMAKLICLQNLT